MRRRAGEAGVVVEPGQRAVVGVAVATLWRSPDAARPVDAPALRVPSDTAAWVGELSRDERVHEGVLSQLLLGERVLVEEVHDGWARGVALDQPADRLDGRGYPGWIPAGQLTTGSPMDGTTYVVDATTTALRDGPDGAVVLADIALGTRLTAAGAARQGWLPVHAPSLPPALDRLRRESLPAPLWVGMCDVEPAPTCPASAADVLVVARRLLDSPYVWGGLTARGIDCSGLVHLAWRRYGVTLPRDAEDQFHATTAVPLGEERPGDLYFFARERRPVHHVGIVAERPAGDAEGDRRMVHACYTQQRVVAEPVTGERSATLVAAHRVRLPATT